MVKMMRSPKEVLAGVEDHIDHPSHTISDRLIGKALEALEAEGYVIVSRNQLTGTANHGTSGRLVICDRDRNCSNPTKIQD